MKTEVLLVEERALFCVEVSRTLAVEWDSDVRNPDLIRRGIREGEADYGPFTSLFQVIPRTGYLEPLSIRVVGTTTEPADIPLYLEGDHRREDRIDPKDPRCVFGGGNPNIAKPNAVGEGGSGK